jgi:quercetin dioxygenase-like cupin family protein
MHDSKSGCCGALSTAAISFVFLFTPQISQSQAASAPAFTSKPIQSAPVSGDENKQIILMAVTIQPGASVPPHTHPGDCVGALVEGAVDLIVQGKESRRLSAGDSYTNPKGTIHWFRNVGDTQARLLNTIVVTKGEPPVQPASAPQR